VVNSFGLFQEEFDSPKRIKKALRPVFNWPLGMEPRGRVIQTFRAQSTLETRRGFLLVRDRVALRTKACLCNPSAKSHFEEDLKRVYPMDTK
jgi:hypothetical protein